MSFRVASQDRYYNRNKERLSLKNRINYFKRKILQHKENIKKLKKELEALDNVK